MKLERVLPRLQLRGTAWPTLLVLCADLGLLACSAWLAQRPHWGAYLAAVVCQSLAWVQLYLICHECTHGAVFGRDTLFGCGRRLNGYLGHLLGALLLLPYSARSASHRAHHSWAGHPRHDPTNARARARFGQLGRARLQLLELAWRYWVPALSASERAGLWRHALLGERGPRRRAAWGYLAAYALLFAALCWRGELSVLVVWAPAFVITLCAEELLNLPHHVEAPLVEEHLAPLLQSQVSHSCATVPIWSAACLYFGLHRAHHAAARVPWYLLPRLERLLARHDEPGHWSEHEWAWSWRRRRRPFREVFAAYFPARTPDGDARRHPSPAHDRASRPRRNEREHR